MWSEEKKMVVGECFCLNKHYAGEDEGSRVHQRTQTLPSSLFLLPSFFFLQHSFYFRLRFLYFVNWDFYINFVSQQLSSSYKSLIFSSSY